MRLRRSYWMPSALALLFMQAACHRPPAGGRQIALVPKLVGIPFFNAAERGARAEAKKLGVPLVFTGPTAADAGEQVQVLSGLLASRPAVIAVSADDPNAVAPVLERARSLGIHVLSWDSDTRPGAREWFVSQVDAETLGRHVMDVLARAMHGRGEYAIITGALTAANLNAWMHWMQLEQREKYPRMKLVAVEAGNDDQQLCFSEAQRLLQAWPHLGGIIGNSSAAPPAAARAVEQAGQTGKVIVAGLSTPNLMRRYILDGAAPDITLWDPRELGALVVAVARQVMLNLPIENGMRLDGIGPLRVTSATHTIIMGPPLDFTRANVGQYHF